MRLISAGPIKSISRPVIRPIRRLPFLPDSVTGNPEKPCERAASCSCSTVWRGDITTGSVIKPCSYFCKGNGGTRGEHSTPHTHGTHHAGCDTSLIAVSYASYSTKSKSRSVMRPSKRLPLSPLSVTGKPEKPWRDFSATASATNASGARHAGDTMKPCLNLYSQQSVVTLRVVTRYVITRRRAERQRERIHWLEVYDRYAASLIASWVWVLTHTVISQDIDLSLLYFIRRVPRILQVSCTRDSITVS